MANFESDPSRGYGATMARMLRQVRDGEDWRVVSAIAFDGMGSFGNGAAMRVAPVGAFFADDFERIVKQARLSAETTHSNIEGIAGAIPVAVACGWAAPQPAEDSVGEFFTCILDHTPESETRRQIVAASQLPTTYDVRTAVSVLGNGTRLSSQDTVPFSLWCAAGQIGSVG